MTQKSKCIICNNPNTEKLKADFAPFLIERMFLNNHKETSLIYCSECNFYFSEYRPSEEELARLYKNYRDEEYQKQREKFEPFYTKEFNESLGFSEEGIISREYTVMKIIKKFILTEDIKYILDWGGDAGQYIPQEFTNAKKYVYDISGITPLNGISLIEDLKELNNYSWDLILCSHVLEHVNDPRSIVNEIISLMKDNTYLYLELPAKKYGDYSLPTHIHEHINFFSTKTLENLLSRPDIIILENIINFQGNISCLIKKNTKKNDEIILLNNIRKKQLQNEEVLQTLILESLEQTGRIKKIFQNIFSIRNEKNHKVIRILGLKFSLKRHRRKLWI